MATRAVTLADLTVSNAKQATWTGLLNTDDGAAVEVLNYENLFVQVTGTFGAGGSVSIQASNDGTNWFAIGSALTAAAPVGNFAQRPRFVRPAVTAGDGTTSLTATMAMQRHF